MSWRDEFSPMGCSGGAAVDVAPYYDSFSHDFKIEVRDQARRLLEQPPPQTAAKPLYQRELASFELRDVRVQPDALVLVMDFRLVVK